MGFWQGVASAYKDIGAERTREKELEEERAFEQEQLMKKLKFDIQKGILEKRLERASSGEDASSIAASAKELLSYGIPETAVTKLIQTGDTSAITTLTGTVKEQFRKAEEVGRGDEYLATVAASLEGGTYTERTTKPLLEGLGEAFQEGGELSAENLGLTGLTYTTPGTALVKPPILVKNPEITDVTAFEKRVTDGVVQTATMEQARLNKVLGEVQAQIEKVQDPEERASLQEFATTLTERTMAVGTALESNKDLSDPTQLLQMFGSGSLETNLKTFRNFKPEMLNDVFKEAISAAPIVVDSYDQARRLFDAGIKSPIQFFDENGDPVVVQWGK